MRGGTFNPPDPHPGATLRQMGGPPRKKQTNLPLTRNEKQQKEIQMSFKSRPVGRRGEGWAYESDSWTGTPGY